MDFNNILFLVLAIVCIVLLVLFVYRRDLFMRVKHESQDLDASHRAAKPLAAARRFAALHQYRVIAPANLSKNGKFADLDFIIVGWFGLLCVKCIGLGGSIYGSAGDTMWLQVDKEKRVSFVNPLRQAEADTRLVRDTLFTANLKNIPVETVCVFTNKAAELALPRSTGHYTLRDFSALLGKDKYLQDKHVDVDKAVQAVSAWLVSADG